MGIACHGESDIVDSKIVHTRCRDAEHVLDVALGFIDHDGVVAAARSPGTEHFVLASGAVKDFIGLRRGIGKGVVEFLQHLGRADVVGNADEGRLHNGFIGSGDGHIAHQTVDHARSGRAASEEELVAESEGCTLRIALGQHDIGENPREVGIIQSSVVELVARDATIVTAKDGEHAVGAKHGVVVDGFGQC